MSSKDSFRFFDSIYRLKELFRQGWIGKVPTSEIESVAEHSYAVASLAMVLVPIENELRAQAQKNAQLLNKSEIIEKSLVHDLPESQYLDLDKSFTGILNSDEYQNFKSLLDANAEAKIQDTINSFTKSFFSLERLETFPSMNSNESEEDSFVKLLDVLELYFQTNQYLSKKFISEDNARSFLQSTREKINSFSKKFLIVDLLF